MAAHGSATQSAHLLCGHLHAANPQGRRENRVKGVALRLFGQMKRNQMLIAQMLQFMAKALAKLPLGVRHNGDNSHIVFTLSMCVPERDGNSRRGYTPTQPFARLHNAVAPKQKNNFEQLCSSFRCVLQLPFLLLISFFSFFLTGFLSFRVELANFRQALHAHKSHLPSLSHARTHTHTRNESLSVNFGTQTHSGDKTVTH